MLARAAHTVTLCLSKGLGAPVGSVAAGSSASMHSVRRWRKALGGGMRQAGVLAAAALASLDDFDAALSRDHALACGATYERWCRRRRREPHGCGAA